MFDWIAFLEKLGIDYVEGPVGQVRRGHVGFGCPICGDDDRYHYAVNLNPDPRDDYSPVRGCWREPSHWRGEIKLIALLANVSYEKAKTIYAEGGEAAFGSDTASLASRLAALDTPETKESMELELVDWPTESELFSATTSIRGGRPYWRYLQGRGFEDPCDVGKTYGLRWCPTGNWSHRILFPLTRFDGSLVGWSGRDFTGTSKSKYKIGPTGLGAAGVVFGWQPQFSGKVAVFCEGPLDAIKLDYYAEDLPVNAFALLGLRAGAEKVKIMSQIADRYDRSIIMLDQGEELRAMDIRSSLPGIDVSIGKLPPGVKDPGDLTKEQVYEWWDSNCD